MGIGAYVLGGSGRFRSLLELELISGNGLKGRQPLELPENLRMVSRSVEPAVAVGLDPLTSGKSFGKLEKRFAMVKSLELFVRGV